MPDQIGTLPTFSKAIQDIMRHLLDCSKLDVPLRQRAKFEGWLKIELAAALAVGGWEVCIERSYSGSLDQIYRADLSVSLSDGSEILVMLKTANTNFRFKDVQIVHRPITKNFKGIIEDIGKLKNLPPAKRGYVLFVAFPVSASHITRQVQLTRYIQRVQVAGVDLTIEDYVARAPEWGIAWYLGEVKPMSISDSLLPTSSFG